MRKFLFLLPFTLAILISCENDDESKYLNSDKPVDTADTTLLTGQISKYKFDSTLTDLSKSPMPIVFSGVPVYVAIGASSNYCLTIYDGHFLQFMIPRIDTFAFTFSIMSPENVPAQGYNFMGFGPKTDIALDGVSGATHISVSGKKTEPVLNSYSSWVYVYVEIIKNATTARMVVKNDVDGTWSTYNYSLDITDDVGPGAFIKLGSGNSSTDPFSGNIDNLQMFSRTLTDEEIENITLQ